jgi:hypothetical protein
MNFSWFRIWQYIPVWRCCVPHHIASKNNTIIFDLNGHNKEVFELKGSLEESAGSQVPLLHLGFST